MVALSVRFKPEEAVVSWIRFRVRVDREVEDIEARVLGSEQLCRVEADTVDGTAGSIRPKVRLQSQHWTQLTSLYNVP